MRAIGADQIAAAIGSRYQSASPLAETVPDQELAHRGLLAARLLAQMAPADPVEPMDIEQHPQEPRP